MNHISLIGIIASVPATLRLSNGQAYSSFLLRVHGSYLDTDGDPYSYHDQHPVVCVGALDRFIHTVPPDAQIEVEGELRSRLHVLRMDGPVQIEVAYYRAEVVADSIRFNNHSVSRGEDGSDDALIALYTPEPA
ncbi:MAG: single-stranded DNA-binding protein [Acidobacteriota bacterium]